MKSVQSLNSIIEKELMMKQIDGGKKLKELYATAYELYRNVCSISAQYQDNSKNIVVLPNEVVVLGTNIKRIEEKLKNYERVEPFVILPDGCVGEPQFTTEYDLDSPNKDKTR